MHIPSTLLAFFVLFMVPLSTSADSPSENIANLVAAGRNLEAHRFSPRDIPSAALDYPENGNAFSFNTVEQPIAIFKIGKFNLTTYTNTRPSLSLPIGKNSTLDIKASRDSIQLRLNILF